MDDFKLVDSEAVFDSALAVLKNFDLPLDKLIFVMTDNCNVMTGSKSGFVKRMSEQCCNIVDTSGCVCHVGNLLMKDENKHPKAAEIVLYAEQLSKYLDNKPTVHSVLSQCEGFLGLNKINDLCPTRFLSLFNLLFEICRQYPLVG